MSRAVCGVCFCPYGDEGDCACSTETHYKKVIDDVQSLFDAKREQKTSKPWVGLTDEEVIIMSRYDLEYAALIGEVQRKLKEKNT